MKKILFLLTLIVMSSCDGIGSQDNHYKIQKSIHITCKGDTVVSYSGTLYHYTNGNYRLSSAIE